jgi:hypothetical protein
VVGATEAAYVFRRDNNVWKQILKLSPPPQDAVSDFAVSVQYQDGVVVVGAYRSNLPGAAYVFQIDTSAGKLIRRARLVAADGFNGDAFGTSVSMTHNTIVVGAPGSLPLGTAPNTPGAAYVFRLSGTTWLQRQKLIAADIERFDQFGKAVAIDRDMIVVGAPRVDQVGDFFGDAVDFYAGGAAYVFVPLNGLYAERQKLRPRVDESDNFLEFGSNVAMFDKSIVVTASSADSVGIPIHPRGYGFSYTRAGNVISARGVAHVTIESASISIANNWILLGSPFEDRCLFGACIGHATLFNLDTLQ